MSLNERKVPLARLISKKKFCKNQLIVLLQNNLKEISQLSKMVRKRGTNLHLIKLVSKQKWVIRKEYTSFLLFYFWDLKLVPIDSALNFASGNLTYFFQKCRRGTKKSSQTWKSGFSILAIFRGKWGLIGHLKGQS